MIADPPWWQAAFAEDYPDVYAHRDDAAAACEVAGALPRLRDAPGPVLDVGCGAGRHLAALRASGIDAFGMDWSPWLLATAAQRDSCRGRIVRADMRRPPMTGGWGAIVLLFTAFGYFDDATNADCLAALAGLLAPGGWLVLDLPEPDDLRANLVPMSERRSASGALVTERRRLTGTRVEKEVVVTREDGERRWQESVRLYRAEEIAQLADRCHLNLVDTWRSLRGSAVDDRRLVHWLRTT